MYQNLGKQLAFYHIFWTISKSEYMNKMDVQHNEMDKDGG